MNQLKEKIVLEEIKSRAIMAEINAKLRTAQTKMSRLEDLAKEFVVNAPADGMVIYSRSWDGKKGPGSRLSSWSPVVAELPDLSDMITKTFVNEVDISKVQKGQEVDIKVDAFPDNEYEGTVIEVANIGQDYRGNDVKVFEIVVQLDWTDSLLRPAMTTSNKIKTYTHEDVLFVPIEGVYSDSLSFVLAKMNGGVVKKEVLTGDSNEDEVIILHGLEEGDEIFLEYNKPFEELTFVPLDPNIKQDLLDKRLAEIAERKKEAEERAKNTKSTYEPKSNTSSGFTIFFD
jgi:hypothetical protein